MLFYRIDAIVENNDVLPERLDRVAAILFSGLLAEKSESLFQKHQHQWYIFGVGVKNDKLTLCTILKSEADIHSLISEFCLPDDAQKSRESFLENLDNISLIELAEDVVFGNSAKEHLRFLAKNNHIRCDKSLLGKIENDDKGFSASDLKKLFENWYDAKLRTSVYPQYKEANTVKAEIQKEQPKGNAIDESNSMIGLS